MSFLKKSTTTKVFFLWICFASEGVSQSLAEKIEQADSLIRLSKIKIEDGYYEEGQKLAEEAKSVLPGVRVLMELNRLNHNIKMARLLKAQENAPADFAAALQHQGFASNLLEKQSYEDALVEVQKGQEAIARAINISREKIQQKMNDDKRHQDGTAPVISVEKSKAGTYLVRLCPRKRDCLWRIASYPEIYGDGWLWTKLYEANRNIIRNPNLIYPGQKLFIPPKDFTLDEIRKMNREEFSVEEQQISQESVCIKDEKDNVASPTDRESSSTLTKKQ